MQRLHFHYESATCALDVWAEAAALGQWSAITAVHPIKFRLRLDHTSMGRSRQVIRGNAQQFMALVAALSETQQQWLGCNDLSLLSPELGLKLELGLGHCLPPQSGLPPLNLSLLQWCDLNDHLDTLNNNVLLLPEFEVKVARWHWSWLTILATALALAGITWATVRVLMPSPQNAPEFSVATRSAPPESPAPVSPQKSAKSSERPERNTTEQSRDKAADKVAKQTEQIPDQQPNNSNSSDGMPSVAKDNQTRSGVEPKSNSPSSLPKISLISPRTTESTPKPAPESDRKMDFATRSRTTRARPNRPNDANADNIATNAPMSSAPIAPAPAQPEPYTAGTSAAPSETSGAARPSAKPSAPTLAITVQQFGDNPELAKNLEQYLGQQLDQYSERSEDGSGLALTSGVQGKITLEIMLQHDGNQTRVTKINVISNSLAPAIPAQNTTAQLLSQIWRWQPNRELAQSQSLSLTVEIMIN